MKYSTCLIILTVLLLAAKLTLWPALSWWWVFAPIYLPIVAAVVIILLIVAVSASVDISDTDGIIDE